MFNIKILTIRKQKEAWLQKAIDEYEKRISGNMKITWKFAKDDKQLHEFVLKEKKYICLDSSGKMFSSIEFSQQLIEALGCCKSHLTLIIGGAEGIPSAILSKADEVWSLSKMTFTHQIVRLILVEQIYRALEIDKGSKYHK